MWGNPQQLSGDTQEAVAEALGFPCGGANGPRERLAELEAADTDRLLEPVGVHWTDAPPAAVATRLCVPVGGRCRVEWQLRLTLESGETTALEGTRPLSERRDGMWIPLPHPVPWGYHRLDGTVRADGRARGVHQLLIVAPTSCVTVEERLGRRRAFGIVANLYAVRSGRNWGAGDFGDLRTLVQLTADWGGAFIGVNPLHAISNTGLDVSPYSPLSRLFRNPLYLDVEAVPEWRDAPDMRDRTTDPAFRKMLDALRNRDRIDYEGVMAAKRTALAPCHDRFQQLRAERPMPPRTAAYRTYRQRHGDVLDRFATFMALADRFGPDWREWPERYRTSDAADVEEFRREQNDAVDFHRYLQYELDRQLSMLGTAARTALPIGLFGDLALGSTPGGADTWGFPDLFAAGTRLGAPPDDYSATGQDWGLPPARPRELRESGHRYWIALVQSAMRHVGAIRLDHVMGLFRQFWIPPGADATSGAYVRFPAAELLAILALESRRNRVLVVGEDLGTVPRGLSTSLRRRGILSTRVLYFERDARGRFKPSNAYSARAIATVTTHDHPPLAGFWRGADLDLKARVEALDSDDISSARADRALARKRLRSRLAAEGLPLDDDPAPEQLAAAAHGFLARTPAPLIGIALDDLTGERVPVNLPGVAMDRHPSWTRRGSVPLEELDSSPMARAVLESVENRRLAGGAGRG
jgi:4-alpha-glucanotransferase